MSGRIPYHEKVVMTLIAASLLIALIRYFAN